MADYIPSVPPPGLDSILHQFLEEQFRYISEALQEVENIQLKQLNAPPDRPRDGLIVLADGTNWEPVVAGGEGYYGYYAAAWHKLG